MIACRQLNQKAFFFSLLTLLALVGAACGPATAPPAQTDSLDAQQAEQMETRPFADDATESRVSDDDALEIDPGSTEFGADGLQVGFTADGHPYRGDPGAAIVIEEYSDYQCPFCARFFGQTLPSLAENQLANGEAVLVYYDFPLDNIHPQATAAANAARCAGEQSAAAYWQMHDSLFANVSQWSVQAPTEIFVNFARGIGLDAEAFQSCVDGNEHVEKIRADLASGSALGVTGTPSFFLNGQILVGAQPLAVFDDAIATVQDGGQLASGAPPETVGEQQPAVAPTPASISEEYAGALGDPDAPVTIVEFTDYQCPYCSRHVAETMPQIIGEMIESGRVYYLLKDFPLDSIHPDARAAAVAVRCAGEQDAYWEMHDGVFGDQSAWAATGEMANTVFVGLASELGLDEGQYSECLDSGRYDDAVEANASEGRALGVNGTPFFFIDGYPLSGARPFEHFEIAVGLAEEGRLAEAFTPQQQQPQQPQRPSGPVEVEIGDAYSFGEADAPVTIVEFTDYQCPFCGRHFQQTYPAIIQNYVETGKARYVFKDFPLNNIHPQAAEAAEAARCAGDQGSYVEMHDMLFNGQQQWAGVTPTDIFIGYAEELELDADLFAECLTGGRHTAAVNDDLQQGIELGVTGTPAFFVNGQLISGAQPYAVFDQAIAALLDELAAE